MCAAGSQESQLLLTISMSCWGITARLCLCSPGKKTHLPVENAAFVVLDKH